MSGDSSKSIPSFNINLEGGMRCQKQKLVEFIVLKI